MSDNFGCFDSLQACPCLDAWYSPAEYQFLRAANHFYTMLSRAICLLLLNLFDLTLWEFRGKAGLGYLQLPMIKRFPQILELPALKEPTRINHNFLSSFTNLRMPSLYQRHPFFNFDEYH